MTVRQPEGDADFGPTAQELKDAGRLIKAIAAAPRPRPSPMLLSTLAESGVDPDDPRVAIIDPYTVVVCNNELLAQEAYVTGRAQKIIGMLAHLSLE